MAGWASSVEVLAPPSELRRTPLVANQRGLGWLSDRVVALVEGKTPRWWWYAFIPSALALASLVAMFLYQTSVGVGVWGNNHPVMWEA